MSDRDLPGILAPPPVLTALCIIAGYVADRFMPLPVMYNRSVRLAIGVILFAGAIAIFLLALRQFTSQGEHPSPYEETHKLLDRGIYGRTRNPIYVAMLVVVLAVAAFTNSAWLFVSLVLDFLLLHFGVVKREERYLSRKLGAPYDDYRRRVRRWI